MWIVVGVGMVVVMVIGVAGGIITGMVGMVGKCVVKVYKGGDEHRAHRGYHEK